MSKSSMTAEELGEAKRVALSFQPCKSGRLHAFRMMWNGDGTRRDECLHCGTIREHLPKMNPMPKGGRKP